MKNKLVIALIGKNIFKPLAYVSFVSMLIVPLMLIPMFLGFSIAATDANGIGIGFPKFLARLADQPIGLKIIFFDGLLFFPIFKVAAFFVNMEQECRHKMLK